MKISIVIPTLNEEKYLPALLGSLRRQTFQNFEVLVADAGSTDKTAEIAVQFGARVVEGGKPAAGRNKGAAAATGDYIFFLDADAVLPEDFCECATGEMERRKLKLATCEILPFSSQTIDKALHSLSNLSIKLMQYSANPHAPGTCILIYRPLFENIGGFDESLYLAEDHEFAKRASRLNPLRVLTSTYIMVSVRRLRKEGRFSIANKYLQVELHRIFNGEIKNKIMEYEFGAYDTTEAKAIQNRFGKLYERIQRINRNLNVAITRENARGQASALKKRTVDIFREKMNTVKKDLKLLVAGHTRNRRSR